MIRPGIKRVFRHSAAAEGIDAQVSDEIRTHIQLRTEQLVAEGFSYEDARREAERRFARTASAQRELMREAELRERYISLYDRWETLRQDVRVAWRGFKRTPGFTLIAVLTLAVGIGASTAIFSVFNATRLDRSLFKAPDRTVVLWGVAGEERDRRGASLPEVADWAAQARTLERVSYYDETSVTLSGQGAAEQIEAEFVAPSFFEMLVSAPAIGRTITADDDRPGAPLAVVISDDLWRGRLNASPAVLGQTLTLDNRSATIIGVMPPGFKGASFDTDVWLSYGAYDASLVTSRDGRWLLAIAQMRPGITIETAANDLRSVGTRLAEQLPNTNRDRSIDPITLREFYLDSTATLLWVLLASVGFLLLIACANVANLQLVRGLGRAGEVAVRNALGANRGRIIRQMLTESLVLAGLGGIAGVALAAWGTRALLPLLPNGVLPRYAQVSISLPVLLFATGLVVLCAIVAGLVPALRTVRGGLADDLRSGARTIGSGALRLQRVIAIGELATAATLLIGAMLMTRSLTAQLRIDPGFKPDGVFATRVALPDLGRYDALPARTHFAETLQQELSTQPGITSVSIASDAPLSGSSSASLVQLEDQPGKSIRYYRHRVTPEFFATMGIPLRSGRAFTPTDLPDAPRVAIVSETFARRFWPGQDAVGRVLRLGDVSVSVIGVAGDVQHRRLTDDLAAEDPDVYFNFAQSPAAGFEVVIQSTLPEASLFAMVRSAVNRLDPAVPLMTSRMLTAAVAQQTASARFAASILGIFATLAFALAMVGLYGVVAFMVQSRRREFALRLAVGADPRQIIGLVVRQGALTAVVGIGAGIAIALLASRLIATLLYGVQPGDLFSFAVATGVLLVTTLVANLIPALRAARVEPQLALRGEG